MSLEACLLQEKIKKTIIKRLFDRVGFCDTCGANDCEHMQLRLPEVIDKHDVIKAIGLGEAFWESPYER